MKVFLIIICGLLLISCSNEKKQPSVAQVGNTTLSYNKFKSLIQTELRNNKNFSPKNLPSLAKKTVDHFIYKTLIEKWASKNNIFVHPSELNKESLKIKSNYPNDDYFLAELRSQNITLTTWTSNLKFTLLEKKALSTIHRSTLKASEEDLNHVYLKNKAVLGQTEAIQIRQIITSDEQSADKAHTALRNKYSFIKTYQKYSQTFQDYKQPETIWIFNKKSKLFGHLYLLKKGEISNIFKSDFGYHIAQLLDRKKNNVPSFNEAKLKVGELFKQANNQAELIKWLTSELKNSKVLVNNELINSVQFKQRVNSAK